jgi:hypothetical protein
MRSVPELRVRKAYAAAFKAALSTMILEVCQEALDVADLRKKLIGENTKAAIDAGIELDLADYDAAHCYMHVNAFAALKRNSGVGLLFSKQRRRERMQLAILLQKCLEGLHVRYGKQTAQLLQIFEHNAEVKSRQRHKQFVFITYDDGSGKSWIPEELEEERALWRSDRDAIEMQYETGEIDDAEYEESLRKVGGEPQP